MLSFQFSRTIGFVFLTQRTRKKERTAGETPTQQPAGRRRYGDFMKRVTGIGGIFFKAKNQPELREWYEKHLGISSDPQYGTAFEWREKEDPQKEGMTTWSLFKSESKYFEGPFMVNYRVDDLDALLQALETEGVRIDPKRENYDYGKFAWIYDPDGNRIELWEPPKEK